MDHLRDVLDNTISREAGIVRDDLDIDADTVAGEFSGGCLLEKRARIEAAWRGDIRNEDPEHYCPDNSCEDEAEAVEKMESTALESQLVAGMRGDRVSTNKMGSCYKALSRQSGGFMVGNCQGNAIHYGFHSYEDGDPGPIDGDDREDFRQHVRSKTWRTRKYSSDPVLRQHACEMTWLSAPLDYLWFRPAKPLVLFCGAFLFTRVGP